MTLNDAFGQMRERRREKGKWGGFFCCFLFPAMVVLRIINYVKNSADLLGGATTVKAFRQAYVIGFVVMSVLLIIFAVAVFKTFKGKQSSMEQLIFTVGAGIVIIWLGLTTAKYVEEYNYDLKNPAKTTVQEYVLCTLDSDGSTTYYLGFEHRGEYLLLAVPHNDYIRLSHGEVSDHRTGNEIYFLVTGSEYTSYENAEIYTSEISVEYYFNSAIFKDVTILPTEYPE
jgi:hypothetical protein